LLLKVNPCKTAVMRFSLKTHNTKCTYTLASSNIPSVDHYKDLGIIFDEKLNFTPHIEFITSKALKLLGLLYRFTDIKDFRGLRSYFLTCALPTIEYCSSIWSMACETNFSKVCSKSKHSLSALYNTGYATSKTNLKKTF